jgi:uncharacterized protein YndB with AHSA1/START domain
MMIRFVNSLHIERPARAVFAALADLENAPRWNPAITHATRVTDGATGIGTRFRLTRTDPKPATEILEITGFEPDTQLELRGRLAGMNADLVYRLEPEDSGTRLTNEVILEPRGPARLLAPMLSGRVRSGVADNLETLKRLLERA